MKPEREDATRPASRCGPCVAPGLDAKAAQVVQALERKALSLATAESCTAGLVAAALSQAEGASKVLHGGFVVYTKANKTKALGVPADLLRRQGSVTEAVARRLAAGVLERSPAEIAVAITGVLGPEPDEDGNPVGLVCFCCKARNGGDMVVCKEFGHQPHDRLRYLTVQEALDVVLQYLHGLPARAP